jgi:sterol 3beta-glucosyltransferase
MITILCSGSRGDFQPYIALAQELNLLGKEVRIAGQRDFEGFIRGYGIDFYPIQADFASLNVDPKMMKQAQNADNPLKMLHAFNKMKNYGSILTGEFYEACVGSEAIVYHPGMTIGYFAAQKLCIPSILASPFPIHTTSSVASVILYGRMKAKWMTRMSYRMLQGMLWMISKDSVKDFWKGKFNELPKGFKMPYEKHNDETHPAVISCSNHVFPRPRDWNPHIHQYGSVSYTHLTLPTN